MTTTNKRVLILAWDFPPYISVGGMRPSYWYKTFNEMGIYPIIVTRFWDKNINNPQDYIKPSLQKESIIEESINGTIIRTPYTPNLRDRVILKYGLKRYSKFRKILTLYYQILKFFSLNFDSTSELYHQSNKYIQQNKVDLIIASAEPFILFKHASNLSKKHNIPWVADYRDCWTSSINLSSDTLINRLIKKYIDSYFEKKYLKSVSFITTAAPSYKNEIQKLTNKNIEVILNGFDDKAITDFPMENYNSTVFTIAYIGTIYPHQPIEQFLDALKIFAQRNIDLKWEIIFYGLNFMPEQKQRVVNHSNLIISNIKFTDKIPYRDLLIELKKASVLVVLAKNELSWLNAKVFDYLVVNKPILLFENDHAILENILVNCNNTNFCETKDDIVTNLEKFYKSWSELGFIEHLNTNVSSYSRYNQTMKLVEKINLYIN